MRFLEDFLNRSLKELRAFVAGRLGQSRGESPF